MNDVLSLPPDMDQLRAVDPMRFPVLAVPSKKSAEQIPAKTDHAVHGILALVTDIVGTVVTSQDGSQFERLFPDFARLVLAYSAVIRQAVNRDVMQRVVWESLLDEEGELRQHGQAMFGEELRDRAIFTVWTMRKIGDLLDKFADLPLDPKDGAADAESCRAFTAHAIRARFALECLRFAAHHQVALAPELVESVVDGMRSAVDSYAWAKEGYDLRTNASPTEETFDVPWDEMDQELLDESMEDLRNEDTAA